MDRWQKKNDDKLEWGPRVEHANDAYADSDDEHEISTLDVWRQNIRSLLRSRLVTRGLALVCIVLLLLRVKSSIWSPSNSLSTSESQALRNDVDWSRFAYVQYATEKQYLCNSIMIFESLKRLGSRASRVMLYPADWTVHPAIDSFESKLLLEAQGRYGVDLVPVLEPHMVNVSSTWKDSFVKLLAFNQTSFDRVISLDSDSTVTKSLDELFLLPSATVAMPRAYWSSLGILTSALMVVEPSRAEFDRVMNAVKHREIEDFDMEIVNHLYGETGLILPHRRYILLTGDFRHKNHARYLGSEEALWDPKKELDEAKFVHFSDWPYPKPWITPEDYVRKIVEPRCIVSKTDDCVASKIWFELYDEFRRRRLDVCGSALARPAGAAFG